jgi:hypothetical protein
MIPQELTERPQWLAWYYDQDGCKIPIGKSNDPRTWRHLKDIKCGNIAFVISEDDPYCGIDLDDCIVDGKFTELANEVLERFSNVAYAEYSPSGIGIKLLTKATKPSWSVCQADKWLECYDHARFWTMTEKMVDEEYFSTIGDGQAAVDWLCEKWLKQEKPIARYVPAKATVSKQVAERAQSYVDAAECAGEGHRNNAAFRLAGHLAAIVGSSFERLSESEVFDYVMQWNSRLPVPMDQSEVASVVKSAMVNGSPRDDKPPEEFEQYIVLNIDWDALNSQIEDDEELDDEAFITNLIPQSGIMRMVFDFYGQQAYRRSVVMGMAVSISLCETIFGRRVRSHTDLRTNDYNLILATTGSGKEACEATITKILDAADPGCRYMIPPDVQSGNGLMKALSNSPCAIWVCDEFGKILQAVLDKKGNQHIKNIGNHLLKLYGKSNGTYGGAAHSDGIRNRIVQPHLCILGLSTSSTVFDSISTDQVADGLLGRIAIWPVQNRPDPREDMTISQPSETLVEAVKSWLEFEPGGNLVATPETIRMSDEALNRWKQHAKDINQRMSSESELRAAVWSRVAARTMKFAMVCRCSRLEIEPAKCQWDFVQIELEDVQWAICISNWLARISCGLIRENVYDKSGSKAKQILMKAIEVNGEVVKRDILRTFRSLTAGDLQAAAEELGLETSQVNTKGRAKTIYRRREQ